MRRIVDSCNAKAFGPFLLHHWASNESGWTLFKNPWEFQVRLRGIGSGYLEGPHGVEAGHWTILRSFIECISTQLPGRYAATTACELHRLCRVRISPSNNVHLVQRACLHRGNGNRIFLLVWQKYGQEKLEFILSATKASAVRQAGCPKIEAVAPLVHCTSYFHRISHLKLTFGKCWMFPREQFCFGTSTNTTGQQFPTWKLHITAAALVQGDMLV